MNITIKDSQTEFISFLKDKLKVKKLTIGITITDDEFVVILATPDNEWTNPVFIKDKIENAEKAFNDTFEAMEAKTVIAAEKKTNAAEVEVEEEKKTTFSTKKVQPAKKTTPKQEVDLTEVERYAQLKDFAKARYLLKQMLTKHASNAEITKTVKERLEQLDKEESPSLFGEESSLETNKEETKENAETGKSNDETEKIENQ